MDHELYERVEGLERLLEDVIKAIQKNSEAIDSLHKEFHDLRKEFHAFKDEQRKEFRELKDEQRKNANRTNALFKQFGARIGSVEERTSAIELRLIAVEDVVFN